MNSIGSINAFVDTMLESKARFETIRVSFEQKNETLIKAIQSFDDKIKNIQKPEIQMEDEELRVMYKNISDELGIMLTGVVASVNNIQKGMKFITDYEQSFNVAVFGKVKAGKSYLGNFIMGNVIRDLGITSSYDNLERPKVEVYDRGTKYTQEKIAELSEEDDGGFRVDPNEATSAIQLFKLGGLTWFDTPGIGSVTWENEMLAKEYVDNADLIVYTSNSDAAGTRQDFKEMRELREKGKRFLLLVTQSDTVEEDCDDDGEIISILMPKSDKDRNDTERYMLDELKKNGISDFSSGKELLTISTKLALTSLKNQDEEMFESSNIGRFLDILKEITKNEGADLKLKTPGSRINATIYEVTEKLEQTRCKLEEYRKSLLDKNGKLSEQSRELLLEMKSQCLMQIGRIVRQKSSEVEEKEIVIKKEELTQMLSKEVYRILLNACIGEFSENTSHLLSQYMEDLQLGNIGELKMRSDEIKYTLHKVVQDPRDPEGIWEHVCSWFGKKYHTSRVIDINKTSKVQLGINEGQVLKLATDSLDQLFESKVPGMMKKICEHIMQPIMELHKKAVESIDSTISELEKIKC